MIAHHIVTLPTKDKDGKTIIKDYRGDNIANSPVRIVKRIRIITKAYHLAKAIARRKKEREEKK